MPNTVPQTITIHLTEDARLALTAVLAQWSRSDLEEVILPQLRQGLRIRLNPEQIRLARNRLDTYLRGGIPLGFGFTTEDKAAILALFGDTFTAKVIQIWPPHLKGGLTVARTTRFETADDQWFDRDVPDGLCRQVGMNVTFKWIFNRPTGEWDLVLVDPAS